jgi:hypothetical protein
MCSVTVYAQQVTVKNDCLADGGQGNICPCFVGGEEAAVWLTSPCNGHIIQVQIFWRSFFQGQPPSLEDSIIIYNGGTFPNPGPVMQNEVGGFQAIMEGPVLTDGFLNAFQWLDEQQTVPLRVPVTTGQQFVVSLRFFNPNNGDPMLPSVVSDVHPNQPPCLHPQCQGGRNTVKVNGVSWQNACSLGVSGDWVIRAVIDCGAVTPTGACCVNGNCSVTTQANCAGTWLGAGTTCTTGICNGACCTTTGNCVVTTPTNCSAAGGTFHGPGSNCATVVCNPMGACCLESGTCLAGPMSPADCASQGGTFLGHGSTCPSTACVAPIGSCCLGKACLTDLTQADCETGFGGVWAGPNTTCPAACPPCFADVDNNGNVDADDLVAVILGWGQCSNCPPDIHPSPFGNNQVNADDLVMVILSWGPCG